jgi:hypothetical protein
MIPKYTYPQETWNKTKCEKVARHLEKDGMGTPHPWRGFISGHSSPYPSYGHTIKYNGGTFINGKHYHSVEMPLPKIAKGFKIVNRISWGYYLERE